MTAGADQKVLDCEERPKCHPDVAGGEGWHFETAEEGAPDTPAAIPVMTQVRLIPAELFAAAPWQTRRTFDDESLAELAASIRRHGLMHPVTVVERGGLGTVPVCYWIVAGERRARACRLLGMPEIPAMVLDVGDDEAREMCVVENMQRRDLALLEEAAGVGALLEAGRSAKDVADRLGRTVRCVARRANLLNLSDRVKEQLADPESELAQAPLEALELAATMPAAWQDVALLDRFGAARGVPSVQYVRGRIAAEMMDLKQAQFDTGDCQACEKRTGCQSDLFDGAEEGLGRCLDRGCFEALARAALEKRIEQARREHPGAVFAAESFQVRRDHPGLLDKWTLDIAKQAGEDTVEGYLVLESGKLRKIHVRQPKRAAAAEGERKPQPTAEQKRRAKVVAAVGKLLEESMEARPCPFERLGPEMALRYISQFGMHHRQDWRDGTDWEELRHGDLAGTLYITWRHCVPVFEKRIWFDAIIRVDEAYDEACEIARELLDVADPDELA